MTSAEMEPTYNDYMKVIDEYVERRQDTSRRLFNLREERPNDGPTYGTFLTETLRFMEAADIAYLYVTDSKSFDSIVFDFLCTEAVRLLTLRLKALEHRRGKSISAEGILEKSRILISQAEVLNELKKQEEKA